MVLAERPRSLLASSLNDRATGYARSVVAGEVVTGRLVRLACERHLRDLETAHERGFRWDAARSERAIDFFQFVRHFEGPLAGQPVQLGPWQCFAIGSVYGWLRVDGTRRFRRSYTEVAKKNGKTLIAGGIGLLDGFFGGEAGAQVYAAATKRDQAKLVWGAAKVMVEKSPSLRLRIKTRALSIYDPRTNSNFRPLGKDTKTEDGINPSTVIVDEIHRHEDRTLLDLLSESFGARSNPLLYLITTAGTTGESVWAEEHDYAERVLEGIVEDDALFAYVANLDKGDDPFDERNWIKANPNLGVSVRLDDMRERAQEAREKPGKLNDFLRLRLNKRTQSRMRWLPPEIWKVGDAEPAPLTGRNVYGGMDLGSRLDLAALVLVSFDDDGFLDVYAHFWCPEEGIQRRARRDRVPYDRWRDAGYITATPGEVTDYGVIRLAVPDLSADCYLAEIGYDPHDATQLASELTQDGFLLVRIMQSTTEMNEPVIELEKLLADGKVRHGGNPVLAWMVDNVDMIQDAAGRRKPDKVKARERIDGVPALLMGLKRAMAHAGGDNVWTSA